MHAYGIVIFHLDLSVSIYKNKIHTKKQLYGIQLQPIKTCQFGFVQRSLYEQLTNRCTIMLLIVAVIMLFHVHA